MLQMTDQNRRGMAPPAWRSVFQNIGAIRIVSIVAALVAWELLSRIVPNNLFPGPLESFGALLSNIRDGVIFKHLALTLLRVFSGLALAMMIGVPVGIVMGLSKRAAAFLDAWLMISMAIPSLCYGLICFIIFGLNEFGAILAIALTGAPSITVNVWEGVKNLDAKLMRMADAYQANRMLVLRHVILPQLAPYIMASLRFGLGLIWKIAILVELLGLPNGVGFELYYWYQLADMRQVLAWTLVFTLFMLFIEFGVFKRLETRLFSWRPSASQ